MGKVNFLFIIHKNGKCTRAWLIQKSNSTPFWFKKILGWIIKILWKGDPAPISSRSSSNSSSNWFHSNTPNSRHLFNTNC